MTIWRILFIDSALGQRRPDRFWSYGLQHRLLCIIVDSFHVGWVRSCAYPCLHSGIGGPFVVTAAILAYVSPACRQRRHFFMDRLGDCASWFFGTLSLLDSSLIWSRILSTNLYRFCCHLGPLRRYGRWLHLPVITRASSSTASSCQWLARWISWVARPAGAAPGSQL